MFVRQIDLPSSVPVNTEVPHKQPLIYVLPVLLILLNYKPIVRLKLILPTLKLRYPFLQLVRSFIHFKILNPFKVPLVFGKLHPSFKLTKSLIEGFNILYSVVQGVEHCPSVTSDVNDHAIIFVEAPYYTIDCRVGKKRVSVKGGYEIDLLGGHIMACLC